MLKHGLEKMAEKATSEEGLTLPEIAMPTSPLFEQNASKIGLLGSENATDVAYVYENLRAFRLNFHMLSKVNSEMTKEWNAATINGCLAALT
ncbi:hypothetical protein SB777_35270, partial [Burkholderia sp. SIMBA_052]